MNGERGVATDFQPFFGPDGDVDLPQSRYVVTLDNGETYKFRRTNVRAERVARPKAKGKGKKGRGKGGM